MNEIIVALTNIMNNGLGLIAIIVSILLNLKKITDFIEDQKKARASKITEALKCDFLIGDTRSFLEEELATEYFKISTGIKWEKSFREAIIRAYKESNGELSFEDFKRARPHLIYKSGMIKIDISWFDKINYYLNWFLGFFMALFGLFVIIFPLLITGINFTQLFANLSFGATLIVFSVLVILQTYSLTSARKIKKQLEENHNNPSSPGH